jgi:hypothetical protein
MNAPLSRSLAGTLALTALAVACQDAPFEPSDAVGPGHEAHAAARPASLPSPAHSAQDLAALRKATARYHRVAEALADGFLAPPPEECVAAPPGGMGYHYVNPGYMDLEIDARRPEALLYEPMSNGKLRLVAAEFLVHGDSWDALHDDPPSFAGRDFDPPSDRAAVAPPGPFYTLHVWIWRNNPSGMFAPFNPRVSCD